MAAEVWIGEWLQSITLQSIFRVRAALRSSAFINSAVILFPAASCLTPQPRCQHHPATKWQVISEWILGINRIWEVGKCYRFWKSMLHLFVTISSCGFNTSPGSCREYLQQGGPTLRDWSKQTIRCLQPLRRSGSSVFFSRLTQQKHSLWATGKNIYSKLSVTYTRQPLTLHDETYFC